MRRKITTPVTFSRRRGFTLVELLVVITIIAILASLFLAGLFAAEEHAKIERTKATIAKINNVIMVRWDSYRTRRVPLSVYDPVAGVYTDVNIPRVQQIFNNQYINYPSIVAGWRLDGLRELMRLEMPNNWTDVHTPPDSGPPANRPAFPTNALPAATSLATNYLNHYNYLNSNYRYNVPTANQNALDQYDAAETLYMICTLASPDELDPRNNFTPDEIGDVDRDGAAEFIDAWGTPIIFIRWAPGFVSDLQTGTDADPFDPFHVYPSVDTSTGSTGPNGYLQQVQQTDSQVATQQTFALYPLIMSAGPDKAYDIVVPADDPNGQDTWLPAKTYQINDPFYTAPAAKSTSPGNAYGTTDNGPIGFQCDTNQNGVYEYFDNIHNHMLGTR